MQHYLDAVVFKPKFVQLITSTYNMEEETKNAGKYLVEILENDENHIEILLNQWKVVDKKVLFKFILWILDHFCEDDSSSAEILFCLAA